MILNRKSKTMQISAHFTCIPIGPRSPGSFKGDAFLPLINGSGVPYIQDRSINVCFYIVYFYN